MLEIDASQFSEWLSLATQIGIFLLVFIFILVGLRLLRILGAVRQITDAVAEIVETVNTILWQPVRLFTSLFGTFRKFMKK